MCGIGYYPYTDYVGYYIFSGLAVKELMIFMKHAKYTVIK